MNVPSGGASALQLELGIWQWLVRQSLEPFVLGCIHCSAGKQSRFLWQVLAHQRVFHLVQDTV